MGDATCTVDGCEKPIKVKSRGWCFAHYMRWRRTGDVGAESPMREIRGSVALCKIEGCGKPHRARGWCVMHWERWQNHGDPLADVRIVGDDQTRFWSYVDKRGDQECWLWTGAANQHGHGSFHAKNSYQAHRFSYELLVGSIPQGLELDHLCRNPPCVNPAHLEPVTHLENVRRGFAARATEVAELE